MQPNKAILVHFYLISPNNMNTAPSYDIICFPRNHANANRVFARLRRMYFLPLLFFRANLVAKYVIAWSCIFLLSEVIVFMV